MCQQCPRTYLPAGNNTKITSLWSFLTESDERCNMCTTFIYCFISQGINSHLNQFLHRTNFTRQVYDLGQIQQLPLLSKLPFLGLCVRGSRHTEILLPIKIHYFELTVTKKNQNRKNNLCPWTWPTTLLFSMAPTLGCPRLPCLHREWRQNLIRLSWLRDNNCPKN